MKLFTGFISHVCLYVFVLKCWLTRCCSLVGRDRSLQCSRSSLKSSAASSILFCHDHAPSGSTDISDLLSAAPRHNSDKAIAQFHQSDSSIDKTNSISQDFNDTMDDSDTYHIVRGLLASTNRDQSSALLTTFYMLLRSGLKSCKTPGCENAARRSGYCAGCEKKYRGASGRYLPAFEYPSDDTASAADGEAVTGRKLHKRKVKSSELLAEEVKACSLSQASDDDDAESDYVTSSSSHAVAAGVSRAWSLNESGHQDSSLCRGPYCNNQGLQQLRGLCIECYRTLLVVNYTLRHGPSLDDIDAGLD